MPLLLACHTSPCPHQHDPSKNPFPVASTPLPLFLSELVSDDDDVASGGDGDDIEDDEEEDFIEDSPRPHGGKKGKAATGKGSKQVLRTTNVNAAGGRKQGSVAPPGAQGQGRVGGQGRKGRGQG